MSNADYSLVSSGAFCPIAVLAYPVSQLEPTLVLTDVQQPAGAPISVGMVALMGRELVQVSAVSLPSITVKRGCGDTVPWTHGAGVVLFFISGYTAVHRREFLGTETVTLKALAKTNAGRVPIEYAPPNEVKFNLRYSRPYPPAQVKTNGSPWYIGKYITPTTPLTVTWVDRNRLIQADQILGHSDAGVTPEAGTTYRMRLTRADGTVVRTISGITGNTRAYTFLEAVTDFGLTNGTGEFEGRVLLGSVRDGLVCWQEYSSAFRLDKSLIGGGAPATSTISLLQFEALPAADEVSGNTVAAGLYRANGSGFDAGGAALISSPLSGSSAINLTANSTANNDTGSIAVQFGSAASAGLLTAGITAELFFIRKRADPLIDGSPMMLVFTDAQGAPVYGVAVDLAPSNGDTSDNVRMGVSHGPLTAFPANDEIRLQFTEAYYSPYSTVVNLPLNQALHMALTVSSGGATLYVGGTAVESETTAIALSSMKAARFLSGLMVGHYSGNSGFTGNQYAIDSVRVNRGVLYTSSFTPPTAPFSTLST